MDTIFVKPFTDDEFLIRQERLCPKHNTKLIVVESDDKRLNFVCPECDKISIRNGWNMK